MMFLDLNILLLLIRNPDFLMSMIKDGSDLFWILQIIQQEQETIDYLPYGCLCELVLACLGQYYFDASPEVQQRSLFQLPGLIRKLKEGIFAHDQGHVASQILLYYISKLTQEIRSPSKKILSCKLIDQLLECLMLEDPSLDDLVGKLTKLNASSSSKYHYYHHHRWTTTTCSHPLDQMSMFNWIEDVINLTESYQALRKPIFTLLETCMEYEQSLDALQSTLSALAILWRHDAQITTLDYPLSTFVRKRSSVALKLFESNPNLHGIAIHAIWKQVQTYLKKHEDLNISSLESDEMVKLWIVNPTVSGKENEPFAVQAPANIVLGALDLLSITPFCSSINIDPATTSPHSSLAKNKHSNNLLTYEKNFNALVELLFKDKRTGIYQMGNDTDAMSIIKSHSSSEAFLARMCNTNHFLLVQYAGELMDCSQCWSLLLSYGKTYLCIQKLLEKLNHLVRQHFEAEHLLEQYFTEVCTIKLKLVFGKTEWTLGKGCAYVLSFIQAYDEYFQKTISCSLRWNEHDSKYPHLREWLYRFAKETNDGSGKIDLSEDPSNSKQIAEENDGNMMTIDTYTAAASPPTSDQLDTSFTAAASPPTSDQLDTSFTAADSDIMSIAPSSSMSKYEKYDLTQKEDTDMHEYPFTLTSYLCQWQNHFDVPHDAESLSTVAKFMENHYCSDEDEDSARKTTRWVLEMAAQPNVGVFCHFLDIFSVLLSSNESQYLAQQLLNHSITLLQQRPDDVWKDNFAQAILNFYSKHAQNQIETIQFSSLVECLLLEKAFWTYSRQKWIAELIGIAPTARSSSSSILSFVLALLKTANSNLNHSRKCSTIWNWLWSISPWSMLRLTKQYPRFIRFPFLSCAFSKHHEFLPRLENNDPIFEFTKSLFPSNVSVQFCQSLRIFSCQSPEMARIFQSLVQHTFQYLRSFEHWSTREAQLKELLLVVRYYVLTPELQSSSRLVSSKTSDCFFEAVWSCYCSYFESLVSSSSSKTNTSTLETQEIILHFVDLMSGWLPDDDDDDGSENDRANISQSKHHYIKVHQSPDSQQLFQSLRLLYPALSNQLEYFHQRFISASSFSAMVVSSNTVLTNRLNHPQFHPLQQQQIVQKITGLNLQEVCGQEKENLYDWINPGHHDDLIHIFQDPYSSVDNIRLSFVCLLHILESYASSDDPASIVSAILCRVCPSSSSSPKDQTVLMVVGSLERLLPFCSHAQVMDILTFLFQDSTLISTHLLKTMQLVHFQSGP